MTGALTVHQVGPAVTVQDMGRPGHLSSGLSCGGAADRLALLEGAALLDQDLSLACLEMAGMGGTFTFSRPVRVALTGGAMSAERDGAALRWHASHAIAPGQVLRIGASVSGHYGYLHVGGGLAPPAILGSRAVHITAGLGHPCATGDEIALGPDTGGGVDQVLAVEDRFSGGQIDVLRVAQSALFDAEVQARFESTVFTRDPRGNRQGVRLSHAGAGFLGAGQLSVLSEVIQPGDIQMTGEGTPYVLLADCQSTGGYPRIGTVAPYDLPRVVQAPPGAQMQLRFVDGAAARARYEDAASQMRRLSRACKPLLRDPARMTDLLQYRLVDGAVNAVAPAGPGALPMEGEDG